MKIVVLAGGTSTERDVSLVTGMQIYKALQRNGHDVVLLDLYLGYEGEMAENIFAIKKDWSGNITTIASSNPDISLVKALRKEDPECQVGPNVIAICKQADLVFLALHGANGEDGKVQAMFDLLHIKYTGTDYLSSAIAMDKAITKELFIKGNVPTPQGITLTKGSSFTWNHYPCIVKVNCGGSSVGVYRVDSQEELEPALEKAFALEDRVVLEQFVEGREFSIGVIAGRALPVIEIAPKVGFYDYSNKYQAGSTVETCPAELPEEISEAMRKCAERVFEVLRLQAYARMDFRMNDNNEFFCLEANTLPGMTPTSLLPQEAEAEGVSFDALCEKLIAVSLRKYDE